MSNEILEQYSNGMWVEIPADKIDSYINDVLARESWYAPRVHRDPMTTTAEVMDFLSTGATIRYDTEWYANIKMDIPPTPAPAPEMVKCACGHTVPKRSVMMASMGPSCPECYDEMEM